MLILLQLVKSIKFLKGYHQMSTAMRVNEDQNFVTEQLPLSTGIDSNKKVVIAVDGPSASGKGTLGKMLAERLNYAFLDTGALYRAVGLTTLMLGGDPAKVEDVVPAIKIIKKNLTEELLSSPEIRKKEVSDAASKVAAIPYVRSALLDYQREFAKNPPGEVGGAVLDGRDIGTVVCPDADVKFFINADVEVRASRRFNDMKKFYPNMTEEQVLADLKIRDERDANRKDSPTKPADDALVMDMTKDTPEEGVSFMINSIKDKMLKAIEAA